MKYYAVKQGNKIGIFDNWEECSKSVTGFKNAVYKSFSNYDDAKSYLNDEEEQNNKQNPFAYVDGSFDAKTNCYSFGCVLIINDKVMQFKKAYDEDSYSKHRNVAGEIKGAGFIIQYAINHGIKELDLYYDYKGIECWYRGLWKANEPISIAYRNFAIEASKKIKVNFYKVKSHTNVYYNEMVDKLAKEALGIG